MATPQADVRTAPTGTALVRFGDGVTAPPPPPPAPTSVAIAGAPTGTTGSPTVITYTLDQPAPVGGKVITPTPVAGVTYTPSTVTIAAGQLSGTSSMSRAADGSHTVDATCPGLSVTGAYSYTSSPAVSAPAPLSASAYRYGQTRLFADIDPATATNGSDVSQFAVTARASVASPKADYQLGTRGPSAYYVEQSAKWTWTNVGGDWVNTDGTPQGTTNPHVTFAANSVSSGSAAYTASITGAAQTAFARGKWFALILMATGAGYRQVASRHHPSLPAPAVSVTYSDGTTGTLACTACVRLTTGTANTLIGSDVATLGQVAVEFELPAKQVASATLSITLLAHTVDACTVKGYMANPLINTQPVTTGLASAYVLDAGITANAAVLFAQRYEDGTTKADYIIPGSVNPNVFEKASWDPSLWGGAADTTKLPTAALGTPVAGTNKWLYKNLWDTPNISIVSSSNTADNFVPAAPGLGAMRIVIPAGTASDGGNVGYSGSGGSDLWMLFPKAVSGLTNEVYVRYKLRIASHPKTFPNTRMWRNEDGATANYAVGAGKYGIGAMHWTPFGGNDNQGGGDLGWSARGKYTEHPSDVTGMMGYTLGVHAYDQLGRDFAFGSDGLGAGFEPDRWYEIEVRLKLNTWAPSGGGASDGECEVWIDGRRDSLHTGWKFRDGPLDSVKTASASFSPFREIGAMGLCLNHYNGGVAPPEQDIVMFYANVVCATSRIGSVKAPPVVISSGLWTPNTSGGNVLETDFQQLPLNTWVKAATNRIVDVVGPTDYLPYSRLAMTSVWCGGGWDYLSKVLHITGGGHGDSHSCENGIPNFSVATLSWAEGFPRSDITAARYWDNATQAFINSNPSGGGACPLIDGRKPANHSFWGVNWVPGSTPGHKGYIVNWYHTTQVFDLQAGTADTALWSHGESIWAANGYYTFDNPWCTALMDGWSLVGIHDAGIMARFDMSPGARTSTVYNSDCRGQYKGSMYLGPLIEYGNRMLCKAPQLRQAFTIGHDPRPGHQTEMLLHRIRIGDAVDAGNTSNWNAFCDPFTITSSDGSHTDLLTAANYIDASIDTSLFAAGFTYDHVNRCCWVVENLTGGKTYKLTGIFGSTWTSEYVTGAANLTATQNGTFERVQAFTVGGATCLLRVSAADRYTEIMRVV